MSESSSLPSSTTEDAEADVEVLATRLMGWGVARGMTAESILTPYPLLYRDSEGAFTLLRHNDDKGTPWNPFTDPRADLQVLERVREVWPHKAFERNERRMFFEALPGNGFMDEYVVGAWARAALAVLREMEEG